MASGSDDSPIWAEVQRRVAIAAAAREKRERLDAERRREASQRERARFDEAMRGLYASRDSLARQVSGLQSQVTTLQSSCSTTRSELELLEGKRRKAAADVELAVRRMGVGGVVTAEEARGASTTSGVEPAAAAALARLLAGHSFAVVDGFAPRSLAARAREVILGLWGGSGAGVGGSMAAAATEPPLAAEPGERAARATTGVRISAVEPATSAGQTAVAQSAAAPVAASSEITAHGAAEAAGSPKALPTPGSGAPTRAAVEFQPGMVGGDKRGEGGGRDAATRSDVIAWVGGSEAGVAGTAVADILAGLDDLVLRRLAEGCPELRGRVLYRERVMLAVYPRGGRYGLHADNPGGRSNGRVLTAIVYLNGQWAPGEGGELRVHAAYEAGSAVAATVEPLAGRLVVFWSDSRTPHSVSANEGARPRCALTCWYSEAGV